MYLSNEQKFTYHWTAWNFVLLRSIFVVNNEFPMRIQLFFSIVLSAFTFQTFAQSDLHIPKEIQEAYKKGTRSKDGKPGPNYWQNFVEYDIEVAVTPDTRAIEGSETITFTNNSPDELSSVVIRLYYDVFKKGSQRGMQVNPEDIGDGVDIRKITVAGTEYDTGNPQMARRTGTNLVLTLPEPLSTGESVDIGFEWMQKVPLTVRRTGAIDSTSFFIAYWYPQVAVYDDVFGWDMINYTFSTEFYNNLGSYNVRIAAPDNFLVWSTGVLQNADDILPSTILTKYEKATTSDEVIAVVTAEELETLKLKSSTWHYTAEEVTDFAIAMSDHYQWDAASQVVEGERILISSAYPSKDADRYTQLTSIQQKTMKHFSEDAPGVPYPYPAFTTFIGLRGGGMEFPMMANNAGPGRGVTIHEMFHTYFPMYVRINERRFAWMDEGWADFGTALVSNKYFTDEEDRGSLYGSMKFSMQGMIGTIGDLPTVTSSQYMGNNYGYHSYSLPSFTYALLYQHLGDERFLEAWSEYIRRWAKKSPTPYDFFYTFEDVSGEDLSWLWNSWYFRMGYPDLAIESFEKGELTVRRNGDRPVPVSVVVEYDDLMENGEPESYAVTLSTSVWKTGVPTVTLEIPKGNNVKNITLNGDFPDFNEFDNFFPSLPERFKDVELNEEVLGEYPLRQFPATVVLSKEEGVLKMVITNSPMSGFMMPDGEGFTSLDGQMKVKILREDGVVTGLELRLDAFGINAIADKR